MRKERVLSFFLLISLICLVSAFSITGKIISSGNVNISIEGNDRINIHSPLNLTYNFFPDDELELDLNVSSEFVAEDWAYSLYDIKHGVYIEDHKPFTPNTTISVVRWGNKLTVYGKEQDNGWVYKNLVFNVNVSNSAPILGYIDSNVFICEGRSLDYRFNASDIDEDVLYSDIFPRNPFYTSYLRNSDPQTSLFRIWSGALTKNRVGIHSETVSVTDLFTVDSKSINLTVIEINNPPQMENLGAQTVWTKGVESQFYKQIQAVDVEDGNTYDGNLEFSVHFENDEDLFEIDEYSGIIDYSPLPPQVGVYSVTVCARDHALTSVHQNISLCLPRSGNSETSCDNFTITVTDENRPPQIIDYEPENNITTLGTSNASFFVETYDPDGTIPDINWYVDGVFKEHNEAMSEDNFSHIFGCGIRGLHNVSAVVTDGLLNTSKIWNVSVEIVACPPVAEPPEGGGGGGGSGVSCWEIWACDDWGVCQNLDDSFKIGGILNEDYYSSKEICNQEGFFERYCGFQIRKCVDLNNCTSKNHAVPKPSEYQVCYFTENPNCKDGVKNCHDGGCEILVDCGGPCGDCPTCSDGKQNQGEFGIDCGGPCPFKCEKETPRKINWFFILILVLLIFLIIFIIIKIKKIRKYSSPFGREDLIPYFKR